MKVSFSTLGCPNWSWREILITAKDLGYDGIEIRGIGKELYVPKASPFRDYNLCRTKEQLSMKNLEIPCLTSSCFLFHDEMDKNLKEGKEYIDVASKLGIPYVRVLGDRDPWPNPSVNRSRVKGMLKELGDYALERDVVVLIETNGVYAQSKVMKELMNSLGHSGVGVLWDIHHPYRYFGETMEEIYDRLGDFICHVHIKDSIVKGDDVKYCLLGHGDLPIVNALDALKHGNYEGYISLEWVKRWYFDLEDPGIVFSHFINTVKNMLSPKSE